MRIESNADWIEALKDMHFQGQSKEIANSMRLHSRDGNRFLFVLDSLSMLQHFDDQTLPVMSTALALVTRNRHVRAELVAA